MESAKAGHTERDVLHYHYFGRRGIPVLTRATRFSWKELPFVKPVKVQWRVPLSEQGLLRLLYGYTPVEMPDKWFVYADGPDRTGKMVISFVRGWTGRRAAELSVHSVGGQELRSGLWTGEVVELTFEGDEDQAERIADAKLREKRKSSSDSGSHGEAIGSSDNDTDESDEAEVAESTEPDPVSTQPPVDSSEERGELWTKFLVATVFKWVLHIDIDVDAPEPKRWTKLACQQAESVPIRQTTYMGSSLPQETVELLKRLGPGTEITFN